MLLRIFLGGTTFLPGNLLIPQPSSTDLEGTLEFVSFNTKIDSGTITHHLRNHINPDIVKPSFVRYLKFSCGTLTVPPEHKLRLNSIQVP